MNLRLTSIFVALATLPLLSSAAFAQESDQIDASFLASAKPGTLRPGSNTAAGGVLGRQSTGGLLGVDSIQNWSSYFYLPGVIDPYGDMQFSWTYTMVGRAPFGEQDSDHTTRIPAPVVPVTMDLRNADGTPRFVNGHPLVSSPSAYVQPVLKSPVFQNYTYDSSERPTQFTDAVSRAEFYNKADDDWHTILQPSLKQGRTMVLLKGTYRFALNADSTCCLYILVDANAFGAAIFPPGPGDTTTVMGQAETAGDVRTSDIASFLFPNTFLYVNGNPANCCILGYHTYDVEPGDATNGWRERRYIMNYSSWISPGLFGGGFSDITALSHEMSETFNDPFVNNATPFWLAPNGNCQNNLETGDVIEGLNNAVYPITMNGFTYHPQNEALLQWFAQQTPSSAIGHAYSYPDKTVLPTAATTQKYACAP